MRVIEPVDQVHVARARAARELAGQRRLTGRGERGLLLVPGEHPLDALLPADGLGYRVQGITGNAPDPLDPVRGKVVDNGFGDRGHAVPPVGAFSVSVSLGGGIGRGQRWGGRVG